MEYQKFIPEGWDDTSHIYSRQDLQNALIANETIEGLATNCDENNNLYVQLGQGLVGTIPQAEFDIASNSDTQKTQLCKYKVNNYVQFKVKSINSDNIILSRKAVQEEAIDWIKNSLEPGQIVKGIVKNIRKFGAFVEIGGGIVGLIHIEDISVSRIKSPEERFKVGQKINVLIKSIEKNTGKVILSYKELLGNWDDNVKDYREKQVVEGIIKEADKYKNGIFVELKPNLVGLAEYKEGFHYGQQVKVFIKKIIQDKKKIKLIIV